MDNNTETPKPICCGNLEKMFSSFRWFSFSGEPNTKLLMPHFEIKGEKWKINHCPSCGADINGIEITIEQINHGR